MCSQTTVDVADACVPLAIFLGTVAGALVAILIASTLAARAWLAQDDDDGFKLKVRSKSKT